MQKYVLFSSLCADLSCDDRQILFAENVDLVKSPWVEQLLQSRKVNVDSTATGTLAGGFGQEQLGATRQQVCAFPFVLCTCVWDHFFRLRSFHFGE